MRSSSARPPHDVFSTGSSFLGSAERQRLDVRAAFEVRAAARARRARRRAERAMVAGAASSLGFAGARAAQLSLGLFGAAFREL